MWCNSRSGQSRCRTSLCPRHSCCRLAAGKPEWCLTTLKILAKLCWSFSGLSSIEKKSAENYFWVRLRFYFRLYKIQRKTFFCLNECKTGNMTFGRRDIFWSELLKVSMAFLDLKTFQMKVDCLMSSTPASLMNQLLKTYHSCLKDSDWNKTAGHKFEFRIFLCKVCCLFLLKSDPAAIPSNVWKCFVVVV